MDTTSQMSTNSARSSSQEGAMRSSRQFLLRCSSHVRIARNRYFQLNLTSVGSIAVLALLFTACQKEGAPPATNDILNNGDPTDAKYFTGSSADPMFALVDDPAFNSMLFLVDPATPRMASRGRYLHRPATGGSFAIDHFTGITWDPVNTCTWLVTDGTTARVNQRSALWRVRGRMPTTGTASILVEYIDTLREAGTTVPVTDAMDIEYDPLTGNIFLLRNGGADPPRLSTISVTPGTEGEVMNIGICPNIQAFSFDCTQSLRGLSSALGVIAEIDRATGLVVPGTTVPFSTAAFLAPDAGVEPWGVTGCEMFAINAFVPGLGAGSAVPLDYRTHVSLRNTLDMTTMP